MRKILLPIVLICFTILCLGFVHIDNVKNLDKEISEIEKLQIEEVS